MILHLAYDGGHFGAMILSNRRNVARLHPENWRIRRIFWKTTLSRSAPDALPTLALDQN